jgi:hypothetical protein
MGHEMCRDCGDVLGTGSFCYRCKWVASGKSEHDYCPRCQGRGWIGLPSMAETSPCVQCQPSVVGAR